MKLKELNEAIATACNVRPQVVTAVQAETFRQLRASLDKGEKVIIPEFGIFLSKEIAATDEEPAKKVVRFKSKTDVGKRKKAKEGGGEGKKREKKATAEAE
jgi:nucleoid DNA-binding protein